MNLDHLTMDATYSARIRASNSIRADAHPSRQSEH